MNAPAPGWNPDPSGRHEYRYWDGGRWTDDVSDNGVTGNDPAGYLPAPGGAPGPGPVPGPGGDPTAQIDPTRQFAPPGAAYGAPTLGGPPPGPGGPDAPAGFGGPDAPAGFGGPGGPGGPDGPAGFGGPGTPGPGGPGAPGSPFGTPGGPPSGPYPPAPGFGGPGGPGSGSYAPLYGSGGQYPVTPPRKSGPSTGLVVGLIALAIAVVAGIAFLVTNGSDDNKTDASKTTGTTQHTTSTTDGSGTGGDTTTLPDSGGDGGLGSGSTGNDVEDAVKQIFVTEIEKSGYTHDQAECAAQAFLDQFGSRLGDLAAAGSSDDPLSGVSEADKSKLLDALSNCGIKDFPGA